MSVKSASDVGAAARETLLAHLGPHLAALPRPLPMPSSFDLVPTREAIRRVQGAACAVSVPGLAQDPRRHGDGSHDATFILSVAVFHENTPAMPLVTAAGDYIAAIRDCLIQRPSLGGFAKQTTWTTESVDLVSDALTPLTLGLGIVEFEVLVADVLNLTPPSGPGPSVVSTTVTVTAKE